jgi:chromosome segregation ATPase
LVVVEYKLTKIFLVWQGPTSEYVSAKAEKIGAKAGEAKAEVEKLLSKVQQGGKDLESMQGEIARLESAKPMSPEEVQKLKDELAALNVKYSSSLKTASEKFQKLKKSVLALGPKLEAQPKGKVETDAAVSQEIAKELSVLKNFEKSLQSQLDDNETLFEALNARLDDFRKRIEEGKQDEKLALLKTELEEAQEMKNELSGALEAVAEEQKTLGEKMASLASKVSSFEDGEDSLAGTKKRLEELRSMGEDAKKQKQTVQKQLDDSLSIIKKHSSKLTDVLARQSGYQQKMQEMKDDYVDISEEISRANEELAAKQKEVSSRLSAQMESLNSAKGGTGGLNSDELQKVSFLLRELSREQALLEEKMRLLSKESDLLKMESQAVATASKSGTQQVQQKKADEGGQESLAFVEKVRLSQGEEAEFERKREELRSLIHKMWEESKGGTDS